MDDLTPDEAMSDMASHAQKGRARTIVTWLFYIALIVFLALYLRGLDWSALSDLSLEPRYLLGALPFSLASRLLQPSAWGRLIRDYGEMPPAYPYLSHVYAKSWLGRYVPGKVAWIGGKVLFGSGFGIRKGVLAVTSVIEAGVHLLTSLGVAFLLFAVSGESSELPATIRIFAVLAFLAMIVALMPPVFNTVVQGAQRLARRGPLQTPLHLSTPVLVRVTGIYLGIQVVGTAVPFLLIRAIYPELILTYYPYVAAATLLAGALGTLAIFAPSGLGVREGVLIVLLSAVIPREVVLVAVVIMRLWTVIADFLFYGLTAALAHAERS